MCQRCIVKEETTIYNEDEARREIEQGQAPEQFDDFARKTCDCCQKRKLLSKFKHETICKLCADKGTLKGDCIIEIDDEPYRI